MKKPVHYNLVITTSITLGFIVSLVIIFGQLRISSIECWLESGVPCPEYYQKSFLKYLGLPILTSLDYFNAKKDVNSKQNFVVKSKQIKLPGSIKVVIVDSPFRYLLKAKNIEELHAVDELGNQSLFLESEQLDYNLPKIIVNNNNAVIDHPKILSILDYLNEYIVNFSEIHFEDSSVIIVNELEKWNGIIDLYDSGIQIQRLATIVHHPEIQNNPNLPKPLTIDARLEMPVLRNSE